jgi:ribosomal protein S18 acetylase RimI-like enzyme
MVSRGATPEDARAIAAIHVRSWQAAYRGIVPTAYLDALSIDQREGVWHQMLQRGGADTWLVETNGQPVGWISVGRSRDTDAAVSTGELYAIYVDPDHWGRGIGRQLWSDAEKRMESSGVSEVTLWVLKHNARAMRFYHSNGFVVEVGSEKTLELGGAELVEIRLRKHIGG